MNALVEQNAAPAKAIDLLPPKQKRFVQEYLTDLNGKQAAIRAGYSARSAHGAAYNMLRERKIAAAVSEALTDRTGVTRAFVVDELAKIARANAGDYFDWNADGVKVTAASELTEDQKAAISEVSETKNGESITIRIKFHDKVSALEKLGKAFGLFNEQGNGPSTALQVNISFPENANGVLYGAQKVIDAQ